MLACSTLPGYVMLLLCSPGLLALINFIVPLLTWVTLPDTIFTFMAYLAVVAYRYSALCNVTLLTWTLTLFICPHALPDNVTWNTYPSLIGMLLLSDLAVQCYLYIHLNLTFSSLLTWLVLRRCSYLTFASLLFHNISPGCMLPSLPYYSGSPGLTCQLISRCFTCSHSYLATVTFLLGVILCYFPHWYTLGLPGYLLIVKQVLYLH